MNRRAENGSAAGRIAAAMVALGLLLPGGGSAWAQATPCDSHQAEAGVPVRAPLGAGYLGALPEACSATAVSLDTRGLLTIALEDFYGTVLAGATLRARLALPARFWLTLEAPGIEWRFAANASLQATQAGLGGLTVGAHYGIPLNARVQLAPYLRFLLPTETTFHRALRSGFEAGTALVVRASRSWEVVGGLSLPLTVTTLEGRPHPHLLVATTADINYRPRSWFTAAAGLGLRVAADETSPLESLDARLGVRFYIRRRLLLGLSALLPMVGRDRGTVNVFFSMGWIFGR